MAMNGQVVAEQIGAQIFIDGWAMVAPGDPERAADLARRAGSVSHDGEAGLRSPSAGCDGSGCVHGIRHPTSCSTSAYGRFHTTAGACTG